MALVSMGKISKSGSIDQNGIRSYVEVWEVVVDVIDEVQGTVSGYVDGDLYDSYDTDSLARLKKKSAQMVGPKEDGGILWTVTCEYDSQPFDQNASDGSGGGPSGDPGQNSAEVQPDLRPPQVSIDSIEVEELRQIDYDNKPVKNSAGQPFNPPLKVTVYRPQITITLFKALGDDSYGNAVTYIGKVNSDTFYGFAANTLICKKYSLQSQFEHGQFWWNKTVVLEAKADGYNPIRILDAGTYELCGGVIKPIRDAEGQPVTDPVPLDGNGKAIYNSGCSSGGPVTHLLFKGYPTISYAGIL